MTDADPRDVVIGVVARRAGIRPEQVSPDARLLQDLHIDGDDAVDTILEIAKKCSVDVSGFDASVDFRSEPSLVSLLPFLPSQKRSRVDQNRPLTIGELIEADHNPKRLKRKMVLPTGLTSDTSPLGKSLHGNLGSRAENPPKPSEAWNP